MKFEQLDFFKKLTEKKEQSPKKDESDVGTRSAKDVEIKWAKSGEKDFFCDACGDREGGCTQCGFGRKKKK